MTRVLPSGGLAVCSGRVVSDVCCTRLGTVGGVAVLVVVVPGAGNMVRVPLGDSRVMSDIPSQIHSPAATMAGDPRYGAKARWRRGSCGGGNLDVANVP